MLFILLGVLLLALKVAEVGPLGDASWYLVLAPFPLAVAWWFFSDKTGRTTSQAMHRDQARKSERRRELAKGMGMLKHFDRKVAAKLKRAEERENAERQKHVDKIVAERERQRQVIRDSVMTSRMDSQYDSHADTAPGAKPGATSMPGKS
jgi:small Trp-rich protein